MGFASAYIHHVPTRLDRHVSMWTHTGHTFNDYWMSECDGVLVGLCRFVNLGDVESVRDVGGAPWHMRVRISKSCSLWGRQVPTVVGSGRERLCSQPLHFALV